MEREEVEEEELRKKTLGPQCPIYPILLQQTVSLGGWTDGKNSCRKIKKKHLIEKSQSSFVVMLAVAVRRVCQERFEASHVTRVAPSTHTHTSNLSTPLLSRQPVKSCSRDP